MRSLLQFSTRLSIVAACFWALGMRATHAELGPAAPANPLLFGANQNSANYDNPLHSDAFAALVRNLNIQNFRHIGGSPASFWEWEAGQYIPESEITAIWPSPWFVNNGANDWVNAQPAGTFSVDAAVASAAAANVGVTQWVANMTTRENDQAAMISYLDQQDYDFSYVEADNEAYFWGAEYAPSGGGTEYGKRIGQKLAPTVRVLNPNAKIGANFREIEFFTGESEPAGWQADWNGNLWAMRGFGAATSNIDALILHHYEMNSNALDGYSTSDRAKAFLAFPQATLERAAGVAEASYDDLPIWLTEYNVIAYNESFGVGANGQWIRGTKNTGWNALYSAGFYLTAISNADDITVMNHHSVNGFSGWGLGETSSESVGQINATGQVFAHVADLVRSADEMMAVAPDANPSLGVTVVGDASIDVFQAAGLRFTSADELVLLIMNRDDSAHDFELSNYGKYGQLDIVTYLATDPGATGYENVLLDTATPIYEQAAAPLHALTSSVGLVVGQPLDVNLPGYSFSILTLSNNILFSADFDSDGDVDGDDFLAWQSNFGTTSGATMETGDADGDGDVDGDDFLAWQSQFGSGAGSAARGVPEPSSALLALFAGVVWAIRSGRRRQEVR